MSIKLVDYKDLQDAILEELKIQSSDTVSLARIKRVINEVYINEVIPFARWRWLEGHTKIKFKEAYSSSTASMTPNSTTVTLNTTPSAALGSFAGYYFSTNSLSEVYIIESHTAGSASIVLTSEYLGSLDATATFKIWTDKVPLPTDCRETVTVWHNMFNRPMDAMGWQKFRELSLISPKAEGFPRVYYTGDYKDPSTGTDEFESDRYRELRVHPAIYTQPVTISVDYIKEAIELVDDGDEPVLPLEDRIVLKYGALKTLWRTIGRNPEEAAFSSQEFNEKLSRMAGKIEDSHDKPQIHVDSIYMKRRRAPRYRVNAYSSDIAGAGGSTTASTNFFQDAVIQGGRFSGNMTADTGITIDGVDISAFYTEFTDHLSDLTDAHNASAISSIASGNLAATDVQAALDELQTDIDTRATSTALTDHVNDTVDAHDASAISNVASGNLVATTVQAALDELQTDVDTRLTASSTATLTNKTFDADGTGNSITNIENADIKVGAAIDSSKIADGSVSNTEFQYISTLTSNAQTQIDGKVDKSTLTTKGDIYVATAASTIARQGIGSDGQILVADSAQTNGLKWSTISGGTNYITNPGAESNTTGWVTYADAAGTRPVNGVDGSPSSTWTRSTSSPLVGSGSFLWTKSAANRQGEGVSYDFTIDVSQKAKVLQIEFSYLVSSGTFVAGSSSADSDMIVYIYDVTNGVLIEPSSIKLLSDSTTVADKFVANFQTASNSTSYRLIIHTATTSASAYTLQFDDFKVAPCNYVYGTPITDWVSYTPTGSLTTNTTYTGMRRRVGGNEEFRIKTAFSGTNTQGTMTLNLPVTIDTARIPGTISGATVFGFGAARDNGSADFDVVAAYNSTTSVTVLLKNSSATYGYYTQVDTSANVPMTIANGDTIEVFLSAPVVGYSSSTQVSDSYTARDIVAIYRISADKTPSVSNPIDFDTKIQDTTASVTTGSGWRFTAPKASFYDVTVTAATSTTGGTLDLYVNGVQDRGLMSMADTSVRSASASVYLRAGDYISINPDSASKTFTGTKNNTIYIRNKDAPTTISAAEVVAASYTTSSQSLGSATIDTVVLTVKDFDTHNAYSTSTGLFTCPVAGYYRVSGAVSHGSRSSATWDLTSYIYVNSTSKAQNNTYSAVNTVVHLFPPQISKTVYCNAGDTISLRARAGYSSTSLDGSATSNHISIERVK